MLVPIILGMGLNAKFPKAVKKIEPFSPIVGVLSTILLVGSAVAQVSSPSTPDAHQTTHGELRILLCCWPTVA